MGKEIDFTFTDDGGLRWRVKSFGNNGEPWLFRDIAQHTADSEWVSVRKCSEQDMLLFLQQAENTHDA